MNVRGKNGINTGKGEGEVGPHLSQSTTQWLASRSGRFTSAKKYPPDIHQTEDLESVWTRRREKSPHVGIRTSVVHPK
jgi:hypothetical protein